jgi:hypothetical protein
MLVFLGRGLITYTPLARRFGLVEPFATRNRQLYSPLCLIIGACIGAVLWLEASILRNGFQ